MLVRNEIALHGFCARLLGYSIERAVAVEHAFRTIELVLAHRTSLVILGEFDLVPIAQALHRLMVGTDAPFILSDWRERTRPRRFGPWATRRSARKRLRQLVEARCA